MMADYMIIATFKLFMHLLIDMYDRRYNIKHHVHIYD